MKRFIWIGNRVQKMKDKRDEKSVVFFNISFIWRIYEWLIFILNVLLNLLFRVIIGKKILIGNSIIIIIAIKAFKIDELLYVICRGGKGPIGESWIWRICRMIKRHRIWEFKSVLGGCLVNAFNHPTFLRRYLVTYIDLTSADDRLTVLLVIMFLYVFQVSRMVLYESLLLNIFLVTINLV